jgi:hypothetical protein
MFRIDGSTSHKTILNIILAAVRTWNLTQSLSSFSICFEIIFYSFLLSSAFIDILYPTKCLPNFGWLYIGLFKWKLFYQHASETQPSRSYPHHSLAINSQYLFSVKMWRGLIDNQLCVIILDGWLAADYYHLHFLHDELPLYFFRKTFLSRPD